MAVKYKDPFELSEMLKVHPRLLGSGSCSATGGSGGWLCQHRFVAITGMVGFRNTVGSAALTNWVSPQSQLIAFGRGRFYKLSSFVTNIDIPYLKVQLDL